MDRASFVFTILFLLLGPIKVIAGFYKVTRGIDVRVQRDIALKATLLASLVIVLVMAVGRGLVENYEISVVSLRIATGVVLLISALRTMFPSGEPAVEHPAAPTPMQLAASPVAIPMIVTPAGVAALLIFVMIAPAHPGLMWTILQALVAIMLMNFLVMFFNEQIVRLPGLLLGLQVFGFVIVFMQIALAVETLVNAFRDL